MKEGQLSGAGSSGTSGQDSQPNLHLGLTEHLQKLLASKDAKSRRDDLPEAHISQCRKIK